MLADSMARRLEIAGVKFGKWTALERSPDSGYWKCRCDCGVENFIPVSNLTSGKSTACVTCGHSGARNGRRQWAERANGGPIRRDTVEYWQAASIKQRSKSEGVPFGFATLTRCADWIEANTPIICPVFGITLARGVWRDGFRDAAPSVDRKIPALGYVPANMQVISMKANAMKSNALPDDLRLFAEWVIRGC